MTMVLQAKAERARAGRARAVRAQAVRPRARWQHPGGAPVAAAAQGALERKALGLALGLAEVQAVTVASEASGPPPRVASILLSRAAAC